MSTIDSITRQKIKGYLEGFIVEVVEQGKIWSTKTRGKNFKPFHSAIIPPEILGICAFERSLRSKLETTFEECARLIALQYHAEVYRSYDVTGQVSQAATRELDKQVEHFEHATNTGADRPNLEGMIRSILDARRNDDEHSITIHADLYIRTHPGEEIFLVVKSPLPNKKQCTEATQRILHFHLLRRQPRPQTQAYIAMAYNPYGEKRESYAWSMARNYTPFDEGVLVGSEFWETIGTSGVYDELLEIYREAGNVRCKYMIDALAFGF